MDVSGSGEEIMKAIEFLKIHLRKEFKDYFGLNNEYWLNSVTNAWMNDNNNSEHRWNTIISFIRNENLGQSKVLDMSSGCGTFVFGGLLCGYDVFGIEPENWKHIFNTLKAIENGYPDSWMKRFCRGKGEFLPFKDGTFDIISTYQTLEHVQDIDKCFKEFKRCLKKNGLLFIQCPDYLSTFEGHYRLPMFPLMNRRLFNTYLKILKRPTKGLTTLNYVTKSSVLKHLGKDYEIVDIDFQNIKEKIQLKYRFCPFFTTDILTHIYISIMKISNICRRENNINIVALKK
jgi:SAM-dependent methyltransferase